MGPSTKALGSKESGTERALRYLKKDRGFNACLKTVIGLRIRDFVLFYLHNFPSSSKNLSYKAFIMI